MILCDTNILIEIYKGNPDIIKHIKKIGQENIAISDVTSAELFFGARDKGELKAIKNDLTSLTTLPINSNISSSAVGLVEKYALSHRLHLPDALIAATAIYYEVELFTLNIKDFRFLKKVKLHKMPI